MATPNPGQGTLFDLDGFAAKDLDGPDPTALPVYQIRESPRARRPSLRLSFQGDLEVVVPVGFDPNQVPALVQAQRRWILRTQRRFAQQRAALPLEPATLRPTTLPLRSRGQTWAIHYTDPDQPLRLTQSGPQALTIGGASDQDPQAHLGLLRDWVRRRAYLELAPWLQKLSQRCDLPYGRLTLRGQTRRWGSCSSQQAISLNFKLLFLPPPLVEYVLIHELCHTIHMNHSRQFWALVEHHCPQWATHRAALKQPWQYLPSWVEP